MRLENSAAVVGKKGDKETVGAFQPSGNHEEEKELRGVDVLGSGTEMIVHLVGKLVGSFQGDINSAEHLSCMPSGSIGKRAGLSGRETMSQA